MNGPNERTKEIPSKTIFIQILFSAGTRASRPSIEWIGVRTHTHTHTLPASDKRYLGRMVATKICEDKKTGK